MEALTRSKFNKWGLALFGGARGQNGPNLADFPSISNLARAIASLEVERDLQKVLQLTALEKVDSFVSYEFSLFNTSENHKSQTVRSFEFRQLENHLVIMCYQR